MVEMINTVIFVWYCSFWFCFKHCTVSVGFIFMIKCKGKTLGSCLFCFYLMLSVQILTLSNVCASQITELLTTCRLLIFFCELHLNKNTVFSALFTPCNGHKNVHSNVKMIKCTGKKRYFVSNFVLIDCCQYKF